MLLNIPKFWDISSEISRPRKLMCSLRSRSSCKSNDELKEVSKKLQISKHCSKSNSTEMNNNNQNYLPHLSPYEFYFNHYGTYYDQNRRGRGCIFNQNPAFVHPILYWNPYVSHNHNIISPSIPVSHPFPFGFNNDVQNSSNGRIFHRTLVNVNQSNTILGRNNASSPSNPVSHSFPFGFNNDVQNNSNGRIFHRTLVNVIQSNTSLGGNNDERIMSLRIWENINKPSNKPGFIFTLMSYNVLAQDLLDQHPHLYKDHRSESLIWEKRWNNLFKEISQLSPDILCLQEVQESHIKQYYSLLEVLGYKGIYKKRTGNQSDGCAIYYKTDNVTLLEHTVVKYFQPTVSLLDRDNIGIIAKFVPRMHPTRQFVVATTHLLYNPKRNDVRMAQMQMLIAGIEKMSYSAGNVKYSYVPVLLTGDFNSSPESDLYEFVSKGQIKYENLSPRLLESDGDGCKGNALVTSRLGITDNCQHMKVLETRREQKNDELSQFSKIIGERANPSKNCHSNGRRMLSHNFNFKSVYGHGGPKLNEGTTFHNEWITVDYIFYSLMKNDKNNDPLQLLSRYRLPISEELAELRIPNNHLGSDHFSLTAKFKLIF